MASPMVAQGTLNRLRGSVTLPAFPNLNITAPYLGAEGINLSPEGEIVNTIETMTGTVPSPAPYQMMTVEVELLKTQSFSDLYKRQLELNALVGTVIVRPDARTLSNYILNNCSIYAANPGRLNGSSVGFMVGLRGFYLVNSNLFNAN